jgi:hypothetical protein
MGDTDSAMHEFMKLQYFMSGPRGRSAGGSRWHSYRPAAVFRLLHFFNLCAG